jgi:protein-S-isoprenylcysteine O-methyltransferase Ste14
MTDRHQDAAPRAVVTAIGGALTLHAVFTVGIPYGLFRLTAAIRGVRFGGPATQSPGALLIVLGAVLYGLALWQLIGRRTSALPGLAPTVLVTDGLFGFTRNPLLAGVLMILAGEALLFRSLALAGYALAYFALLEVLVKREEMELAKKFGPAWTEYCARVPRWLPRLRRRANGC